MRGISECSVLTLRANNCFWVDVSNITKTNCYKCVPVSFSDFAAEPLHHNVDICRDINVIYHNNLDRELYCFSWSFIGSTGESYVHFKVKYPGANANAVWRYCVKHDQAKLELQLEENVATNEAYVWKYMSWVCAKHMYMYLVKSDVPLRCIDKWSHALNTHIDTRTVFRHIIQTTQGTHLRCFQFRKIDLHNNFICLHNGLYFLWKL